MNKTAATCDHGISLTLDCAACAARLKNATVRDDRGLIVAINQTITPARPTVESARELGIFSEIADGRIRVWGPLAEVKRWWALAGCDLVDVTIDKAPSWHAKIGDEVVGYICATDEDVPMVRENGGWSWRALADAEVAADAPRGRMAYGFTSAP